MDGKRGRLMGRRRAVSGPPPPIEYAPGDYYPRFRGTDWWPRLLAGPVRAGDTVNEVAWWYDVPVAWVRAAVKAEAARRKARKGERAWYPRAPTV